MGVLPFPVFVPVAHGGVRVGTDVNRFGKRNHADGIGLIQFGKNALVITRICAAVIPVVTLQIGGILVVEQSERTVLRSVQRAVYHKSAAANGSGFNMMA